MYKNGWIRKMRLISEFMTVQPAKQTIAIYVLPNISRSKSNQTIKFGQLRKCNTRANSPEKSYTKFSGKTISRKITKKIKIEPISG